jgi:hypothetical protein
MKNPSCEAVTREREEEALANLRHCSPYLAGVSKRTKPKKPANLRSWRVIIIRSKGEYLGSVEAPDRERAEAVAVKQFDLGRSAVDRGHLGARVR